MAGKHLLVDMTLVFDALSNFIVHGMMVNSSGEDVSYSARDDMASYALRQPMKRQSAPAARTLSSLSPPRLAAAAFVSSWPSRASLLRVGGAKLAHSVTGRGRERWHNDRRPPLRLVRTNDGKDVPQLAGEGVYGLHSVRQALESGHRNVHALYVREEFLRTTDGHRSLTKSASEAQALGRVKELAQATGVPVHATSKWMLNHITGDKPHQVSESFCTPDGLS